MQAATCIRLSERVIAGLRRTVSGIGSSHQRRVGKYLFCFAQAYVMDIILGNVAVVPVESL